MPEPIVNFQTFKRFRVPIADVRELCRQRGLPRPKSARRISRGEVSALFKLVFDDRPPLVLKVFVRPIGAAQMASGALLARELSQHASIATPRWLFDHPADDVIPYPHAIMEFAEGEDADSHWPDMSRPQREAFVNDCAVNLRALHSSGIDVDGPDSPRAWMDAEMGKHERTIAKLREQGWMDDKLLDAVEGTWRQIEGALPSDGSMSIVHHDFQPHNLRIDPATGQITAVLDFDNVTIAPGYTDARDLALNVFLNEPELGELFWEGYGKLGDDDRAIFARHCLTRVLGILSSYHGPTAGLSEATVRQLLQQQ